MLRVGQTLKVNAASRTTPAIPTSVASRVVASTLSKVGQKVTVPSNSYGGQCVALVDKIVQELTDKNMSYTNAIDCLEKAKSNGFQVIYDTWGIRKKFERGEVRVNTKKFVGYEKDKNGNLIINEERAQTV